MKTAVQTLAILGIVAFSSAAWAEGDAELSQEYFDRGAGLYVEGKFGEALVQFKRGHEELPNPMFPYSMALCSQKLGRYSEAMRYAIEARDLGGLGDKENAQNDARIAVLPRIETSEFVATEIAASQIEPDLDPVDPGIIARRPPKSGFGTVGWVGVGATAVGAGLLVGSLVSELSLQTKWDEFNRAADNGDQDRYDELKKEIERGQTTGMVLLYSGLGVSAVGLSLIIVELVTGGSDDAATAGVFVLPDGTVGGGFSARF